MPHQVFDSPFQPISLLTSTPPDLLSSVYYLQLSELPRLSGLLEISIAALEPDSTLADTATGALHLLAAITSLVSRPLLLVNPLPPLRALELLRTLAHERLIANAARNPEWKTLSFQNRLAKVYAHFAALKPKLVEIPEDGIPSLRHQLADLANHIALTLVPRCS